MKLKIIGSSRRELIVKLLLYSSLYGLFLINWIDLFGSPQMPGYHLWLISMYFAPFIPVLLLLGFDDWELVVSLGLIASLMNDLFYYPVGMILFGRSVDLVDWYAFQFGFRGLEYRWWFNGGFFTFPVSSLVMGLSIYFRFAVTVLLVYKWWRE